MMRREPVHWLPTGIIGHSPGSMASLRSGRTQPILAYFWHPHFFIYRAGSSTHHIFPEGNVITSLKSARCSGYPFNFKVIHPLLRRRRRRPEQRDRGGGRKNRETLPSNRALLTPTRSCAPTKCPVVRVVAKRLKTMPFRR